MAKNRQKLRWLYLIGAIFGPLFVLFWAVSGRIGIAAEVTVALLIFAVILVPFVIVGFLLPIAIHELGHFAAGRRAGFKLDSIQIGPYTWDGRKGRMNWNVTLPLGLCSMHRRDGLPTWREALLFSSGGALANLAAVAIGFLVFELSGGRFGAPLFSEGLRGWIQFGGWILIYLNGGAALLSLMPFRIGTFSSDGLLMVDLWKRRRS